MYLFYSMLQIPYYVFYIPHDFQKDKLKTVSMFSSLHSMSKYIVYHSHTRVILSLLCMGLVFLVSTLSLVSHTSLYNLFIFKKCVVLLLCFLLNSCFHTIYCKFNKIWYQCLVHSVYLFQKEKPSHPAVVHSQSSTYSSLSIPPSTPSTQNVTQNITQNVTESITHNMTLDQNIIIEYPSVSKEY